MIDPTVPESKLHPASEVSNGRDEWVAAECFELRTRKPDIIEALQWDADLTASFDLFPALAAFHKANQFHGNDEARKLAAEYLNTIINEIIEDHAHSVLWPEYQKKVANGDFLGE